MQPAQVVTPSGTILQAQAVDGKALRGATACGAKNHLVSLVQHGSGITLAQAAVEQKRSEITAVPALLCMRALTDTLTTMDALLTQRALAQLIHERNGFYLMIVKANQPQLRDDLALFFHLPAIMADQERWDRVETHTKGHGQQEYRLLEVTTGDCAYLGWPGATHVIRRTCTRMMVKMGKTTTTVSYGLTNLPLAETSAALVERL